MNFYEYVKYLLQIKGDIIKYNQFLIGTKNYAPCDIDELISRFDDLLTRDPKTVNWKFLVKILTKTCGIDIWMRILNKKVIEKLNKNDK